MKIPKKYEEMGIFHSIQPERYTYHPRTTDRRRKAVEKWRYRAVFALLTADGTWDIMRNAKPESRREAQDWIDERIRQHHDEGTKPMVNRKVLFSTFAETYKLKLKKRDLATFDEEIKKIDMMIGFFKDDALRDVDYDRIGQFEQFLFDTPHVRTKRVFDKERNEWTVVEIKTFRKNATVHRYMSRLQDLLKQAAKAGKIKSVPVFDDVIVPRLEAVRTSTITTDQFLRLLDKCDDVVSGHDRSHLRLPLIASHELGCRVGELQAVKRADILYIDHERRSGVIRMPIEKTRPRKFKEVPITNWLYEEIIENKILERGEDEMAFFKYRHYRRSWGTLRELAGIDPSFKWHDLRAVNTTNRRHSNQNETELQQQVGHAKGSRMTDKHYYRPHFEQLMESIEGYNGYIQRQLERSEAVIDIEGVSS